MCHQWLGFDVTIHYDVYGTCEHCRWQHKTTHTSVVCESRCVQMTYALYHPKGPTYHHDVITGLLSAAHSRYTLHLTKSQSVERKQPCTDTVTQISSLRNSSLSSSSSSRWMAVKRVWLQAFLKVSTRSSNRPWKLGGKKTRPLLLYCPHAEKWP